MSRASHSIDRPGSPNLARLIVAGLGLFSLLAIWAIALLPCALLAGLVFLTRDLHSRTTRAKGADRAMRNA